MCITEEKCNAMRQKLGVFSFKPGISGYAQVHGRDDVYYKNKAILDAVYVKNASIAFDLKLIFQTVAVVLKRDGNNDEKSADNAVLEEIAASDVSADDNVKNDKTTHEKVV